MYSTFLAGKASHKDVKDSSSWLFKLYYGNRMFMGFCCVACEILYITLFLIADKPNESLRDVLMATIRPGSALSCLVGLSLFGWSIKQVVNIIQMKTAADACAFMTWRKTVAVIGINLFYSGLTSYFCPNGLIFGLWDF